MSLVKPVDVLAFLHAARRREIARECAAKMLAFAKANNRSELAREATEILATLNGGMS